MNLYFVKLKKKKKNTLKFSEIKSGWYIYKIRKHIFPIVLMVNFNILSKI